MFNEKQKQNRETDMSQMAWMWGLLETQEAHVAGSQIDIFAS